MNLVKKSKFLSLILRHQPEVAGISLDKEGWANVTDILSVTDLDHTQLDEVVYQNNKKRFEYNGDKTKIRARQGHSVKVDVGLKKQTPPRALYHGTKAKNFASIQGRGLLRMNRLHVHLSKDEPTALVVAKRREGQSLIVQVDALRMHNDGYDFFLSNNGVWLTEHVPPQYLMSFGWPEGK